MRMGGTRTVTRVRPLRDLGRWIVFGAVVGVVAGLASALFLTLLADVTR